MYALINQFKPDAGYSDNAGYVYSIHQTRAMAEGAAARALTRQRILNNIEPVCVAQIFNGRTVGQNVFRADIQPIICFNVQL